ncbi:DUF4129 domain-containing protein [Hymenobacter caeli]|uniref:DUF4129 domain-containing protein n=1 Tax=Hymenobacter caeli TaxID=2735894 RepID=UPI003639B8FB
MTAPFLLTYAARRAAQAGLALALLAAPAAGRAGALPPGHYAGGAAHAQPAALPPLPPDRTLPLPARRPDAARLRELRGQREFRYVEAAAETGFWDNFWARIWRWLDGLRGTRTGRVAWNWVFYLALAGILGFAVLKLLQVDLARAFGRAPRRAGLPYDLLSEDIHAVDFPARLAEAEAAGNLRLAARLGYLEVLKHLSDGGRLDWQPDKTNRAYLAELPAGALREAFRECTRQFEYVWYGELPLSAALYQQVRRAQRGVAAASTATAVPA